MKIDDYIFIESIGKGAYSEVFLAMKKGSDVKYAVKKYKRASIEGTSYYDVLNTEIKIMWKYNHKNIIKVHDIKKTINSFYEFLDYCNGGTLSKNLENYQSRYGKPFSQEIVQYLMKQIIDGLKILHDDNYNHENINLNSILVNFDTEMDKEEINMMKSTIKISHLKNLTEKKNSLKKLFFLMNLGIICYEMIFGKKEYDLDKVKLKFNSIEEGNYNSPFILSKEIISFMKELFFNYENMEIEDLLSHTFLTKNIKDFELIEQKVSDQKNQNEIDNKHLCSFCTAIPSDIILSPCGHKCFCKYCYLYLKENNSFEKCPICGKHIESVIEKVYEI